MLMSLMSKRFGAGEGLLRSDCVHITTILFSYYSSPGLATGYSRPWKIILREDDGAGNEREDMRWKVRGGVSCFTFTAAYHAVAVLRVFGVVWPDGSVDARASRRILSQE